jgi:hypothetical protein
VRRATLERTYGHRLQKRRALLATSQNESISRLHVGTIRNLQLSLASKLEELESRRRVSVGLTPIAAGRITFVSPERPLAVRETPPPPDDGSGPAEDTDIYPEPSPVFRP